VEIIQQDEPEDGDLEFEDEWEDEYEEEDQVDGKIILFDFLYFLV